MDRKRENLSLKQETKVSAVAQARDAMCEGVPLNLQQNETRQAWFRRAGSVFGLSAREVKKIFYREKKRIDADTMDRIRDRLGELREQANDNQARLNELIFLRNELRSGGSRSLAGVGNPDAADRNGSAGNGRGEVPEDRPSAPIV